MSDQTLYKECPRCIEGTVTLNNTNYTCSNCGLVIKDKSRFGLFNKGKFAVERLGEAGEFSLAEQSLKDVPLTPDPLKITIGNVYTDEQLATLAGGDMSVIRPVRTILAQIILEQLREECFVQVVGLRRAHGPVLPEQANYHPSNEAPRQGMNWQDEGNLFCTTNRLVLPSNTFTFIRMDRKIVGVQAFNDGVAVQRKGEEFATYFVGCHPHEAALVAAYVLAKIPLLRDKMAAAA